MKLLRTVIAAGMIAWLAELTGFTCTATAQQREVPDVAVRDATRDPVPLGKAQQKVPVAKQQGAETKQSFPTVTPQERDYLDKLLNYWEARSKKIQTYRCEFDRFEYDAVFGGPHWSQHARTVSTGLINYAIPDKGEFAVHTIHHFEGLGNDQKPTYRKKEAEHQEHWICDGDKTYEFDPYQKQLKVMELPAHLKGTEIVNGPLPFMFGADAKKLKSRYWMRPRRSEKSGEYWIEARPLQREDSANYSQVWIFIDAEDYLPKGMVLFHTDGRSRTTFHFKDRKVNAFEPLRLFKAEFYRPKTPAGWKLVNTNFQSGVPLHHRVPQASPRQAARSE